VAIDSSWYPLEFGERTNNVTAFSTELLTEIGKTEKIAFVKLTVNWDTLLEGLKKKNYEAILTSMPPYIFNEKLFDFSEVYLPLGPVLVVPVASTASSLQDLSGKEIAIIAGSSSSFLLEPIPGVLIRDYGSVAQALNSLASGAIDGALIDILSAVAYCKDLYQGSLKIVTPPLTDEGLRLVALHGGAPELISGFNRGLQRIKKSGSYDELLAKWGLMESLLN
jgi:polar amino acid transport system substrate-binding protein